MKAAMIRLCLFMLAGLLVSGLGRQVAYAQQGDLTTIDDPLGGEYELLSIDDLVVQGPAISGTGSNIVNYILETEDYKLSRQTEDHAIYINCIVNSGPGQLTRIGRFFAIDRDVMVTLHPNVNASGKNCADTVGISNNMAFRVERLGEEDYIGARVLMSTQKIAVAMADFTQDGLDDLFVLSDAQAFVLTAANVNDHTSGFKVGPLLTTPAALATVYGMSTGDLNTDGFMDVAWITSSGNSRDLEIATICPGPVAGTLCANAKPLQVILSPGVAGENSYQFGNVGHCTANTADRAIAIGNFAGNGKATLVNLYPQYTTVQSGYRCHLSASWYEFDGDFGLVGDGPLASLDALTSYHGFSGQYGDVLAEAAALNWFGEGEQLIVGFTQSNASYCQSWLNAFTEEVAVITFAQGRMTHVNTGGPLSPCTTEQVMDAPSANVPWLNGMATGHFTSVPEAGVSDISDYNLQIATLLNSGHVRIYEIDTQNNYKPSLLSDTALTVPVSKRANTQVLHNNWLHAGDLQGRGMRLGAPTVVRVSSHNQPLIILGHPPMHTDYVLPAHSTSLEPEIINFSVIPEVYYSRFNLTESDENQSTSTETTSYSYGYAESVEEKFKVKVPLVSTLSGSFKQAWEQEFENTTEKVATTQTSSEFNASSTTTLGDQLWFMENGFNLYFYPVLGQTICPAEKPNCSDAEKQPLVVQFSGPNSTSILSANGATTEWYQPVHQPGQIFSYPWNQQQLESRLSKDLDLLTQVASFVTDDSDLEQEVSWSSSGETEKTVGASNSHSFETENSLSAGHLPKTGAGLKVTGKFDYNNSSATESLNSSTSTVGGSTGIEIAMPGTFLSPPQYKYLVQGSIFGQAPPPGMVQNIQQNEDIKTTGPLHVAFIADPTSANAGSWWTSDASPYVQHVDVALNHPARWEWGISTNANSASDLRCLFAEASKRNCVEITEPDPTDIWNSPFYWMRGLLVTVDGTGGPQRNYASAGDQVYLQARVYNYSLKDMDPSHKIKVRFYRQPIKGTTPVGDSVLISEETVSPLRGFNSQPNTPNWTTVTTSFDTTGLANQYFIFWVVVWLEDANGNKVAELPGHGLVDAPGTLTSLTDVELEEVTLGSGEEAETLSFSNNVGFFHSKFYVAPAETGSATIAAIQPNTLLPKELRVEDVALSAQLVDVGESVIFSANVASTGADADGISVRIFHVAPGDEEVLLDHEVLPHIPAGGTDIVSIPFRPRTAGPHEFVVVATRPGAVEGIGHATLLVTEAASVDQTATYLPVVAHE